MADPTTLDQQLAGRLNLVTLPVDTAGVDNRYRVLTRGSMRASASTVTGAAIYLLTESGIVATQSTSQNWMFLYLNPSDWAVTGRTTYLRLTAACMVNDIAPAITMTAGLYPTGTPSGASGVTNPNIGTVVTGSTVPFATPAANSKSALVSSGDFAFPAAGVYVLGLDCSGAMAGNSQPLIAVRLDVRNV